MKKNNQNKIKKTKVHDSKKKKIRNKKRKTISIIILVAILIALAIITVQKIRKNNDEKTPTITAEEYETQEFVEILDDGTKLNKSSKLNETKQVDDLKFENIKLTETEQQTILTADVTNVGNKEKKTALVDVTLLDKNENELVTLGGIVDALQAGETKQLNIITTLDYSNAYDLNINIKRYQK